MKFILLNQPDMRINVAIANSHQIFRLGLIKWIESAKDINVVLECSNGKELLQQIDEHLELDVLLLDMQMSGIGGLNCCETIKKKRPDISIIILSHLSGTYFLKYAIHLKLHGYFTKDSESVDLLKAIRQYDDGGFHYEKKLKNKIEKINDHIKKNPNEDISRFDFSKRELEIIYLTAIELKSKEIGSKLNISPRTVEGHKNNLIKKTNCKSFLGVILIAMELRLISLYGEFDFLNL
ncbi:MAG: hypothetical protein DI529_07200 [Chryseobacterium sp.]|nr:MAG: hypothetical protein DI529_07200 [Chryseobacterium sp.]